MTVLVKVKQVQENTPQTHTGEKPAKWAHQLKTHTYTHIYTNIPLYRGDLGPTEDRGDSPGISGDSTGPVIE